MSSFLKLYTSFGNLTPILYLLGIDKKNVGKNKMKTGKNDAFSIVFGSKLEMMKVGRSFN